MTQLVLFNSQLFLNEKTLPVCDRSRDELDAEDQALAPRFVHTSAAELEVTEGDQLRINCRVNGRPPPDIYWYMNGQRLVQDDRHRIIVNEQGYHALLITSAALTDNGIISCLARNSRGEAAFQVFFKKSPICMYREMGKNVKCRRK